MLECVCVCVTFCCGILFADTHPSLYKICDNQKCAKASLIAYFIQCLVSMAMYTCTLQRMVVKATSHQEIFVLLALVTTYHHNYFGHHSIITKPSLETL